MQNTTARAARIRWSRRTDALRNLLLHISLRILQQGQLEPLLTHICREVARIMNADPVALRLHGNEFATSPGAVPAAGALVLPLNDDGEAVGSLALQPARGARFTAGAAGDLAQFVQDLGPVLAAARSQERLQHLATHDPLTGLPNRRLWEDAMMRTTAGVLLLIDVDGFKQVNDTLGHPVGDQLLVELAGHMQRAVRKGDLLARLGGDEFAVLVPDVSATDAHALADRLRREVGRIRLEAGGLMFVPTISIGMAAVESPADWKSVVRYADLALYRAKHQGKNCTAAMQ